MNNYTNRSVLTSQFSDYQQPTERSNYLEEWLNKLKSQEPCKYVIDKQLSNTSSQFVRNNIREILPRPNLRKQSFEYTFDKQNINTQNRESKDKPFVAAMKALQTKVKSLESQKNQLKQLIQQKDKLLMSSHTSNDQKLTNVTQKYQQLMVSNQQYKVQLNILENSYLETDRVKVENIRLNQQIKRLQKSIQQSEKYHDMMSNKYSALLRQLQTKTVQFSHLQFQYQLSVEQLQVSKGQIKALKVKLLNYQYQDESLKTKNNEQYEYIRKTNSQIQNRNEELEDQLSHTKHKLKEIEQTYLSELQKQEKSLQKIGKQNEGLKQKCKQLENQLQYLKETINQKDTTIIDLYKTKDMSSRDDVLINDISVKQYTQQFQQKVQKPIGKRKVSRQKIEIDDSLNNGKSFDKKHDKSFEITQKLAQSQIGRKGPYLNKNQKSKIKNKSVDISRSSKSAGLSKLKNSRQLPFENALIKLKAERDKHQNLDKSCLSQNIYQRFGQQKIQCSWQQSKQANRLLLIQAQKQAIRLYQIHESLLQQSENCVDISERAQNLGRLKQLDSQIRANNQKLHLLKSSI